MKTIVAGLLGLVLALALLVVVMLHRGDGSEALANYNVIFEASWSASTHPYDFPVNPHFSGLVGATHHGGVSFWEEGELASEGMKNVAERGRKDPLTTEIDDALRANTAFSLLSGGGIGVSPGAISLAFNISKDYPLVTLVSMIAPSPDWFVGVSGLSLLEDGKWVAEKVVDLYLYDAGTDSGTSFSSPDAATTPPLVVARIDDSVLPGSSIPYGTFTFTRRDV